MSKNEPKRPPLEDGLLTAFAALDNQIAREMQRSPEQLSKHGVQKWEPYSKRVESVTTMILDALGSEEVQMDSLIVLAQATAKALSYAIQDLGQDGLGKIRTGYCLEAVKQIGDDCYRAASTLRDSTELM